MKKIFAISLIIFWTGVTALLAAGLVVYETTKADEESSDIAVTGQGNGFGTTTGDASLTADLKKNKAVLNAAMVAEHAAVDDCWLIVEGKVYDVTEYIPFHPGGENEIIGSCGKDATAGFNDRDGEGTPHSASAKVQLKNYYVANLGAAWGSSNNAQAGGTTVSSETVSEDSSGTVIVSNDTAATETVADSTTANTEPVTTTKTTSLTQGEVALHNSASDCWLIISGKVYDVTEYIPFHPGGRNRIINNCGTDSTALFTSSSNGGHRHGSSAKNTLARYYLGDLGSNTVETTSSSGGAAADSSASNVAVDHSSPEEVIQAAYPGANIIDVSMEDDGRSEVKFYWQGEKYEAKLNSANEIVEVDD